MLQIDETLALDLLTLCEQTERAGDVLDPQLQRTEIEKFLEVSEVISVRRNDALVAFAMLRPQEQGRWFVIAFNTHPDHRSASVFRELFAPLSGVAKRRAITALRSSVYKTNRLSMDFHIRLGFKVTRENARGVGFTASLQEITANPANKWTRALRSA